MWNPAFWSFWVKDVESDLWYSMYMVFMSFRVSSGVDSMISNSAPSASIFTRSVLAFIMCARVVVWVIWVLSDFFVNEWLWESSLRYRVA